MIFKREPAFWLNLVAAVIAWLSTWFLHLSPEIQSVLNGLAFAIMGVITAYMTGDGQVAGILGLFKAVFSLGMGFGLHLSDEMQSSALTLVAIITTMFIRTQVTAPVPPATAPVAVTR